MPRNTRSYLSFVFGEWWCLALQQRFVDEITVELREKKKKNDDEEDEKRNLYGEEKKTEEEEDHEEIQRSNIRMKNKRKNVRSEEIR